MDILLEVDFFNLEGFQIAFLKFFKDLFMRYLYLIKME